MRKILSAAAISAIAVAQNAAPASSTALTVKLLASGTIVAGCSALTQSTALAFGSALAPLTTPTATGGISTTCASAVPEVLTFAVTGTQTASTSPGELVFSGTSLEYGLFSDSAFASGIGSGGITLSGSGAAKITPIYAKLASAIPTGTSPGAYTDTVTVTLTF